jgi:Putative Flp pilus-assembly TadE/G-like
MLSTTQRTELNRFTTDTHGAVGMIFALSLTGVIMFAACAIDIGRASAARTKVGSAVDAATIYAAKRLAETHPPLADLESAARILYDENMKTSTRYVLTTGFKLGYTGDGQGIVLNVKTEIPTTFARIAGINKIDIPGTATAIFSSQDIEVGLQLDVTGSMGSSIGGKVKIDSLKAASKNLLDILLPDNGTGTTKVRVGIAPFAAGVNAGGYAKAVAGVAAPGNCVYERRTAFADKTDDAPYGTESLKTLSDLPPTAQKCPSGAKVAALTTDKAALNSTINALAADGSTAGHLGTSWAWYLLSPKWAGIWPSDGAPAAYDDTKTRKFAILMTDGIYNTVGGISHGDSGAEAIDSQKRAKDTCDAMKSKGIAIYTVGFIKATDPAAAADTLKYCASSLTSFYKAEDGAQLDAAFKSIAKDISRLRLSK